MIQSNDKSKLVAFLHEKYVEQFGIGVTSLCCDPMETEEDSGIFIANCEICSKYEQTELDLFV
jgi:hypothetical protein